MNVTTEIVQTIDYTELEKGIKEILGIDYEIVAMEEVSNDNVLRFDVSYRHEWMAKEANEIAETKNVRPFSLNILLFMLMWQGAIKEGTVNVLISW